MQPKPLGRVALSGELGPLTAFSKLLGRLTVAALVLGLQYFWFRNIFLMSPPQSTACQQLVVRLMRDGKLEVQEMAASTLAGMLKGLSEPAFRALQSDLLAQANRLFPKSRKRGAGQGTEIPPSLGVVGERASLTPADIVLGFALH